MFITFAFPYMNGPLHLGHLYTLLQGWIAGQRTGKPYLLPFGFHCTGMPIFASAEKLARGDQQVKKMLLDMDIPEDNIKAFKKPEYWTEYFPERALETLRLLDLPGLDLSRGFITTELNPYFDSFVRWQFKTLERKGLVYYGTRPCIYSLKDQQPCAAHDRQTGEDAVIQTEEPEWIKKLSTNERAAYLERNGTDAYPSERVISRSGDTCVIRSTEQWFIRYSDPEWKQEVINYIKTSLIVHDEETRRNLVSAAENLHDWCFSREFGLGTKIPWDQRFLIDSLSDSTIYPVFYNFVPLLKQLTEVPDTDFWDSVFGSDQTTPIIEKFRSAILTQDIRVSAKDLVNNHLVMMIYNSIAIDKRLLPKEYRINGYVKVNGEKMSKSIGNFVTVEQAVRTYPKNALLIALLEAGDGTNDANVRLSDISCIQKSLDAVLGIRDQQQDQNHQDEPVKLNSEYEQILYECWTKSNEAWAHGRAREALSYGWRKAFKSFTGNAANANTDLNRLCVSIIRLTLRPVIGCDVWMTEEEVHKRIQQITTNPDVANINLNLKLKDYIHRLLIGCTGRCTRNRVLVHHKILQYPGAKELIEASLREKGFSCSVDQDDTPIHEKRDPYKVKPLFV